MMLKIATLVLTAMLFAGPFMGSRSEATTAATPIAVTATISGSAIPHGVIVPKLRMAAKGTETVL
jgi:hypothetical protein